MVEIRIDTCKDSKEDIKKVIEYLKSVIGEEKAPEVKEEALFEEPNALPVKKKDPDDIEIDDVEIKPMFY